MISCCEVVLVGCRTRSVRRVCCDFWISCCEAFCENTKKIYTGPKENQFYQRAAFSQTSIRSASGHWQRPDITLYLKSQNFIQIHSDSFKNIHMMTRKFHPQMRKYVWTKKWDVFTLKNEKSRIILSITVKWLLYMSDDVCRSSLSVSFYDYKKYKS